MGLDDATLARLKALLAAGKTEAARELVVAEAGLSAADALAYINQLPGSASGPATGGRKPISTKVIGYAFLGIGLVLAAISGFVFSQKQKTLRNSFLTRGEVIGFAVDDNKELWQGKGFDPDEGYAPVIRYAVEGKVYEITSSTESSPPPYDLHEKLEIYVNHDDPFVITINSFLNKWLGSLITGIFAFIFTVVGILVLIFKPQGGSGSNMDRLDRDEEGLVSLDDFA